ncbi:epoxide hydrolase [Frankia sp. AgB1.9]|uniref:epoxide hydrolase family protein n=1 Tax=unclassified Frankia TaxID=2632575 RepID=UPI001933084D|nr:MULTISPECIES: epoxide hydrolase family protein [unclassified Frankia]MBL7489697.1 epoxide hydrolase [Frankia sp. AgW1.1]MBL7548451.1 epoxide hydrolase [Frankia sp. AgB1.9]MBL7621341.1 epoxide hydrolase [Frankia sp. AgB1.8]
MTTLPDLRPFRIDVPRRDLDDLRVRLSAARWPSEVTGAGTDYGMPLGVVQRLANRWSSGYDWRAHEARLNEIPQFTTTIDGQNIHFLHVRSGEPAALPLLLLHGWPSSVAEFLGMIGPLTDPRGHGGGSAPAFDVVVPSLPGYGFSGPVTEPGWDSARMARAFATLMERLGYRRWGAVGGDAGALVGRELGILGPEGLVGVHLLQIFAFPSGDPAELAALSEADRASLSGSTADFQSKAGYQKIQQTRPQTLGYGLTDSPIGQLAWNAELWTGWGDYADYLDVDTYLTHVSIYWFTRTGVSSARHYYEDAHSGAGYRELPNKVPTAVAVFPEDYRTVRAFAERANNVVRYREFDRGGHFAYTTDPDLVVDDLRQFFADLG